MVDLEKLLAQDQDLDRSRLPVLDPDDPEGPTIGTLQLTIKAKDTLGHLLHRKM